MKRNDSTTLILCILSAMFLGLLVVVAGNDAGCATEIGLLK